ncbi:MAG TPA: hypothetical protein VFU47_05245 [Armatimonadota bacterium]|nr:hypothetical protein [Armatimonadota bacterium]
MIPVCALCHSHYCLTTCTGPLPSQRPGVTAPPPHLRPVEPAALAGSWRECLSALADLREELDADAPSLTLVAECASVVGQRARLEDRAYGGEVLRRARAWVACVEAGVEAGAVRELLVEACARLEAALREARAKLAEVA